MRISDIQFHKIQFWVHIHGLEVDKFSKSNSEKIGRCIRDVIEVDEILGLKRLDRDFIRIKVEVDTKKPLMTGFWYTGRNGGIERDWSHRKNVKRGDWHV